LASKSAAKKPAPPIGSDARQREIKRLKNVVDALARPAFASPGQLCITIVKISVAYPKP
jgi:hypothetical protein